ncbi:hypothetical protein JHW43_000124 [Diplocarpon mali]|nr:hypothetical protein JHW43_000124 [Diplocarpon mali]
MLPGGIVQECVETAASRPARIPSPAQLTSPPSHLISATVEGPHGPREEESPRRKQAAAADPPPPALDLSLSQTARADTIPTFLVAVGLTILIIDRLSWTRQLAPASPRPRGEREVEGERREGTKRNSAEKPEKPEKGKRKSTETVEKGEDSGRGRVGSSTPQTPVHEREDHVSPHRSPARDPLGETLPSARARRAERGRRLEPRCERVRLARLEIRGRGGEGREEEEPEVPVEGGPDAAVGGAGRADRLRDLQELERGVPNAATGRGRSRGSSRVRHRVDRAGLESLVQRILPSLSGLGLPRCCDAASDSHPARGAQVSAFARPSLGGSNPTSPSGQQGETT